MKPAVNLAVIALASALLSPVLVAAGATTSAPEATAAPVQEVARSVPSAAEPACARKVKVVYAGYSSNTGCAPAESTR